MNEALILAMLRQRAASPVRLVLLAFLFGMPLLVAVGAPAIGLSVLGDGYGMILVLLEAEFLGIVLILMMAGEMTIMAVGMVMMMMNPAGLNPMMMVHQQLPLFRQAYRDHVQRASVQWTRATRSVPASAS